MQDFIRTVKHILPCTLTLPSSDIILTRAILLPPCFLASLLPWENWVHWSGEAHGNFQEVPPVGTVRGPGQRGCRWDSFVLHFRASVFAFSGSSRDFCKKILLGVVTRNFKNALSLLWADVCVSNCEVMHINHNREIHHWHATRSWFAPGTKSVTHQCFM